MGQSLKPNGMLLILDLYENNCIFEKIISIIAVILNQLFYLIKRGRLRNTLEERNAWKDHFKYDFYSSIDEIKNISNEYLGKVIIKHHLFWRYSLIYKKDEYAPSIN
jgi:hypothetical protein